MKQMQFQRLGSSARGFTLVELIVALTVVSAAMSVLISMFGSGMDLAAETRNRSVAAELAEMQLALINASPHLFLWRIEAQDATGLFPISAGTDDPKSGNLVQAPEVRMASRRAQERNDAFYHQFRWKAWGHLAYPESQAYEVTVSIHWRNHGRLRTLAITSSVPRYKVGGSNATVSEKGAEAL